MWMTMAAGPAAAGQAAADNQNPAPAVIHDPLARYLGKAIAGIELRGASSLDPAHALELTSLRVGQPLERDALRQSIRALFASGFYRDIQVEAEPAPADQVALTFVTDENFFVGQIWIEGAPKAPPTHVQLVDATKLQLGERISQQSIRDAIEGVQQELSLNGYRKAQVEVRRNPLPQQQQVELTFVVTPGALTRVGRVEVTGDPGYTAAQVQEIAELDPGKRVGAATLRSALERLRKKYRTHNRLQAQVAVEKRTYQPATNTEDYALNIRRGPRVEVVVEGASLRRSLLKKYVPIFQEGAVDADLLNEGARNLRDYFETRGYFDVRVSYARQDDAAADLTRIVYTVEKGILHKLVAVGIEGNHLFDSDTLTDAMQVQPSSLFLPHGRYSQTLLERDVDSIAGQYRDNGYLQVEVRPQILDDYQGVKGHMKVLVQVNEGPQTLVASLNISGNQSVPTARLLALVGSTEGQPFSAQSMAVDRESVLNYYLDLGFPDVQFHASVKQVAETPPRMAVTYSIVEGEPALVNQVFVSGLHFTRPAVVNRQLELTPGGALSQDAMLASQQNLYDLDLFNQVSAAIQNPEGTAPRKNVLFQLEEARRYSFDYGLGFEVQTGSAPGPTPQGRTGASPRVSFDATRINFRGRDQTLSFKSRYGRLEQEALLSFQAPHWFDNPKLRFIFTTFYDITRDVRTFTAERLEGSAQIEQQIGRGTALIYGFLYRRVKVDPRTLEIDPNLIPLLSKPVRVGMPVFTYIRDHRDNPLDSTRGSYNTFDSGISTGYFGSEASFSRFLFTNNTYHQFHRSKVVFARSTQIGVENTLGSSTFIPLPERFYAGGAGSIRGFALNQAGPRDLLTGFPVGGQALLVNQMELRFPAPTLPFFGTDLSPVIFEDAGNVFTSPDEMFPSVVRFRPNRCNLAAPNSTCDFNYFSHAVGAGLRYRTPIGPVRVDVGYSPNPPTFPVLNNPLAPFQTLRRWNLFFSVGQSF